MNTLSRLRLVAFASMAAASATLGAQQAPAVQLAFGYECGDRFLIKNDGGQPVVVEWRTTGGEDRSTVRLGANESREIASASNDAVELWVGGKLVATEQKGSKPCASGSVAGQGAGPTVIVRPLNADAAPSAGGDPPSRVARLSSLQGGVSFQAGGSADWGVATLNASITSGDRLVADDGSRAELELGSLAVRLGSSTDLTVTSLTDGLLQLGVPAGTVRLSVYRMQPSDTVEVDTPNGAVSILAPGNYRVSTNAAGTQTFLSVERGRAELNGPGLSQQVEGGRTVRLSAGEGGSVMVANVPRPGPDGFDSWSSYRDGVLTSTTSPSDAYVNPDIPGVRDLDAAGRWESDGEMGPVWYPTVVVAGWVPYRYGHWAWVEPWGWAWVDDEPWGFAPFHYGRWAFLRNRWGWVPGPRIGRPCYAPALVAFADGGGFGVGIGVSAWFPLGPRDPYFPWYHHGDRYLRSVNGANVRGVTDIGVFVHVQDRDHFRYAHRSTAMTVVPTAAFASGRPLGHEVVRVTPERIAQAHVTPHPGVVPAHGAEIGGVAAPRPHAAVERMAVMPPPGDRGVMPGERRVPPTKPGITQVSRPLVVHSPVPQPPVPFVERQKAISEHPGRPLEPQQLQNLRAGRPAGPPRDPEPPHAQPPREQRGPEKKPAPPPERKDKKPA